MENREEITTLVFQCPTCKGDTSWLIDKLQAGVPSDIAISDMGIMNATKVLPPHKSIPGYEIHMAVVGTDICLGCGQVRTKVIKINTIKLTRQTSIVLPKPPDPGGIRGN